MLLSLPTTSLSIMLSHLFLLTGALAEMDGSSAAEQVIRAKRNCPMSPYATFLSQDQQETLHELVTEARQQGADESTVKCTLTSISAKFYRHKDIQSSETHMRNLKPSDEGRGALKKRSSQRKSMTSSINIPDLQSQTTASSMRTTYGICGDCDFNMILALNVFHY
ncbi:hypothetical protein OESDEN_24044 [Oesophagostomum dentatum]|uniref:Uncharacterized protein n=1 Tax=Oesophagostomum dentatum TaxID=61180 RepID=A0A0B1RXG9_OESDE|nr:hypothetical protein OESDEN_24044 [Oesophagostomum dentatum]